jgi:hypothetical protein
MSSGLRKSARASAIRSSWRAGAPRAALTFGFDLDLPERIVRGTDAPPLGLVLFRGAPDSPTATGESLAALLEREDLDLVGRITVVKGDQVRQRPFPPAR